MELLTPNQIESLARAKGLAMLAVCKTAGLAPSTYNRWKSGKHSISVENYVKIYAVVSPSVTTHQEQKNGAPTRK